jgi:hypothetical protein
MWIFYLIVAFPVFLLQILLPLATLLHLDLVTIYIVFVSLREKFIFSVSLALLLGISLDCYGMAPLGLQAGILLLAVIGVEFLRHHLNFFYFIPQILGMAIITSMQALFMTLLLHLLMPVDVVYPALVKQGLLQIGVTALSAPIVLGLFSLLENLCRRWLLIKS